MSNGKSDTATSVPPAEEDKSPFPAEYPLHPLDPLTHEETVNAIEAVRKQCAAQLSTDIQFHLVHLIEYEKEAIWAFDNLYPDGAPPSPAPARPPTITLERKAFVMLIDKQGPKTYEAVVLVGTISNRRQYAAVTPGKVLSFTHVKGVQPSFVSGEYELCEEIVLNHPEVLRIFKERGINPKLVTVECWCTGNFGPEDNPRRRLTRPLLYYKSRDHPNSNPYARPLGNICPIVDMISKQIIRIEDSGKAHFPIVPAEDTHAEFAIPFNNPAHRRKDLKPLMIVQPDGPSFHVDGWNVKWQGFSFRIGFNPREGVTIHNVTFAKPQHFSHPPPTTRPIVYRMSFSEMVVPYGDPTPPNVRKNAFDAGEDGLGNCINSLENGCDCLGEIHYFPVKLIDGKGRVIVVKNAICLHEEDDGILWKHKDWHTGHIEVRRGRKLIVNFMATVANYDYAFSYHFKLDGTIKLEVKMTGIVSTSALLPEDNDPKYGTLIAPQLNAPVHQHFFTVRLDMAIDGKDNRVEEVNVVSETLGPHNPRANAFYPVYTLIENERMSGRTINYRSGRYWRIVNNKKKNRLGRATAYKLVPSADVVPFAHPSSSVMNRASYLSKHLWVTAYHPDEIYASGRYPNQREGSDGVAEWVKKNRSLVDTDVILWYTMGVTHVVVPEQWPVMPVDEVSIALKPAGFFDCNPTLDVPPNANAPNHQCPHPIASVATAQPDSAPVAKL